jgi:hypothetical protein
MDERERRNTCYPSRVNIDETLSFFAGASDAVAEGDGPKRCREPHRGKGVAPLRPSQMASLFGFPTKIAVASADTAC